MREFDIAFRVQENINLMILQNSEYELVIKITYDMFAFCGFVPIFIIILVWPAAICTMFLIH